MFFVVSLYIGITFLTFLLEITHKEYISIQLNSCHDNVRSRTHRLDGRIHPQTLVSSTSGLFTCA